VLCVSIVALNDACCRRLYDEHAVSLGSLSVSQVLGERAHTAEGAESAGQIEKKESFLPAFFLSASSALSAVKRLFSLKCAMHSGSPTRLPSDARSRTIYFGAKAFVRLSVDSEEDHHA
jgi:hypothetical protein